MPLYMRVEAVRSDDPELAWSFDDEGMKFREESTRDLQIKTVKTKKRKDDDDGPGPSGLSISILPFFSFAGSPSLA
jgi:hypothetical protein